MGNLRAERAGQSLAAAYGLVQLGVDAEWTDLIDDDPSDDIDMGGVIGGIVIYEVGPFGVYAKLDKTIGGSEGLTGTFGAKVSHRYERFIFSADVSGTWADDKHMESYFGVTSIQSDRSGL